MRTAYALLGLLFIGTFVAAYVLVERAEAPTVEDTEIITAPETTMSLTLTSTAFEHNGSIPPKYTCDDENVNPPLSISGVPEDTESLVLVMDDPDIPESVKQSRGIEKFDHWVLYNLSPDTAEIPEGQGDTLGSGGLTSRGEAGYVGPCPPDAEHRYIFRIYALSGTLNFITAPTLDEVETAAQSMMLEKAELIGRYERQQ